MKYTINKVLSEKTGLSDNTVKYVNRVRNARKNVAWKLEVDESIVTAEQIHDYIVAQGMEEPSLQVIKDIMPHLGNPVPIEDVEEKHLGVEEKGYAIVEKSSCEMVLEKILSKLSPLQALFFLRHKMAEKSHGNLDLLATDSKIVALCKTDKTYGKQYEAIMKLEDEEAIRQRLHDLMKRINGSATRLFSNNAIQCGLEPDDLIDVVGDWACRKLEEFE